MRMMMTKTMIALGLLGAMAIGTASPSAAQGVYFEGPGVGIGIGVPYRDRYYYRYDRPYAYQYNYSRPGWYDRRDYRSRHWDWD
jgi:hypothetical protein